MAFIQANNEENTESLRISTLRLAIAAALLTVIQHVVGPARLAASFTGILDGSLQNFYLQSDAGIAHGMSLVGMLAIITGLIIRNRTIAIAGAVFACLSFAMVGHTVTHSPRWLLAPLLAMHIAIVAFWFGSLRPLRRFSGDSHTEYAALLDRFSRIASRAVPVIFVAGLGLSILLLGSLTKLVTPYGFMILGKISGFALLLSLAIYNRYRLSPGIHAGDARAVTIFRRVATAEWIVIAIITIATVTMTSLVSP